jgi:NNP family nitrate/nitrite transporter-like MFS transporter
MKPAMTSFRKFLRTGHAPTLFAAFLYFAFSCCTWVLNGAMAPFISDTFHLSPAQKGLMLSVPIIAGALFRFPLGVLSQYIGRKRATLVEMSLISVAMLLGFFFVQSFSALLAMGVLLGVAGASFGVAMSLGSGSFPAEHKGLAMGIVGAGNVGTAVAVLIAPPLAQWLGWQTVYAVAAVAMVIPMAAVIFMAREPQDIDPHAGLRAQLACLVERDGWAFSVIYAVTFGGFIGFISFLPSYYHDQFGVTKVQAGQLTMLAAFMGAAMRVVGGWLADRFGGINTLTVVLAAVTLGLACCGLATGSLPLTTALLIGCFAALGAGNGAVYQLVPLRWPLTTAVAGSMIGELGALGGGLVPGTMGLARQYLGTYAWGFAFFASFAFVTLVLLRALQSSWTGKWVAAGGRAHAVAARVHAEPRDARPIELAEAA